MQKFSIARDTQTVTAKIDALVLFTKMHPVKLKNDVTNLWRKLSPVFGCL